MVIVALSVVVREAGLTWSAMLGAGLPQPYLSVMVMAAFPPLFRGVSQLRIGSVVLEFPSHLSLWQFCAFRAAKRDSRRSSTLPRGVQPVGQS